MFSITKNAVELDSLKKQIQNDAAGALVTFEGWVRNHNEGKPVSSLEYEAFDELCYLEAEKVINEAKEKYEILDVTAIHRVGHLAIGDIAVWIGVSSKHRQAAFQACQYVIDEIKLRLPIWKKEHYVDGKAEWVNCQGCYHHAHHHVKEADYYDKQIRLKNFGEKGQQKLKNAKVLVVGAGGLGCPALTYLSAAGVGKITIVDNDKLEISNLHRQTLYGYEGLGEYKAVLAKKRLNSSNPFIEVEAYTQRLDIDNIEDLVGGHDVILDCTDNFKAKFLIHDACFLKKKVLVQASIFQVEGQLQTFDFSSIEDSSCQRCIWPEMPKHSEVGNCAEVGVVGVVPGILGVMQATEAIKTILNWEVESKSYTLLVDLANWDLNKVKRTKNSSCKLCGEVQEIISLEPKNYGISSIQISLNKLSDDELNELQFIDIRAQEERRLCSPWESHMTHVSDFDFYAPKKSLPKKLILVCSKGIRSLDFCKKLRTNGVQDVFSLSAGLSEMKENWTRINSD